jgi:predicted acetyltransferase
MQFKLIRARQMHRLLLRQLFELYVHEFSAWTQVDVDSDGRFTPDDFLLDGWRRRDGGGRYLLQADGQWAGFAFVERGSYVAPGAAVHWLMDEFFILRRYRGRGAGRWFAVEIMRQHPGAWEVGQIPENTAATAFWRRVLAPFEHGVFEEKFVQNDAWHGLVQTVHVR